MVRASPRCSGSWRGSWPKSLTGRRSVTSRSSSRLGSSWQSTCRPRRRSASRCRPLSCCAPTRRSNEAPRVHHAAELSMKARDQDKEENQSNGEAPLPAVSANTLARCLGVTPKIIYDLTKEGVIERGSGRLFQLEDSVRRYCEHLRRQTGGSS